MISDLIPFPNRQPTHRVWVLWKTNRVLKCEIKHLVSGYAVRIYLGGKLYHSRFDTASAEAYTQAADLKRMLLADGWTAKLISRRIVPLS
jgi:hypothetical protein